METALISIVSIAIIIISVATMTLSAFQSTNTVVDSWKQMEQQASSIRQTEIALALSGNYTGGDINLMAANQGQTDLADFSHWDVIAQRQNTAAAYIVYTENATPGNNEWTVSGIYLSNNTTIAEVFDPNILNPGETMKVIINLNPEIVQGETGRITMSAPNGVTSECLVTRQ